MIKIERFVFGFVEENTYLVYDDETHKGILIDCGCMTPSEEERLLDFIQREKIQLQALLITHTHFDHVWGVGFFRRAFPEVPLYAPHKDIELLPPLREQVGSFIPQLPEGIELPKEAYRDVQGGEQLQLGEIAVVVREVPGHSPGHVVYYLPQSGVVFSGDTLFRENIGRVDLWGGSMATLLSCIRRELFSLPGETIVYPGHGEETSITYEKANNPYLENVK